MKKYTCKHCNERLPITAFRVCKTTYKAKDGTFKSYESPRHLCRYCESKKGTERRIARELETINKSSGVRISLRTVLDSVKRRMNKENDMALKLAYAQVGLELNNLLLRL